MSKQVLKHLPELLQEGLISEQTAANIQAHYEEEQDNNRQLMIFGLLGAVLVGLGVILIVAHNWDDFSRPLQTAFAFLPLLISQGLGAFALLKKPNAPNWRESTATLIFFSLAACLSLISQIYHLPGTLGDFTLSWMILALPLIYVMPSSMVSLLFICGTTYYGCEVGYFTSSTHPPYLYWLLLGLAIPHYYQLIQRRGGSNFTLFHHWLIPLSLIICLGSWSGDYGKWMFIAYFSLLGVFYLLRSHPALDRSGLLLQGYAPLGAFGSLLLLFIASFYDFWEGLMKEPLPVVESLGGMEFWLALLLTGLAVFLAARKYSRTPASAVDPLDFLFVGFLLAFCMAFFEPLLPTVWTNLLLFGLSLATIWKGIQTNSLARLNLGLMIMVILISCRFFDTELSFVLRGIIFMLVGGGFFYANYWLIKKRKQSAS